METRLYWIGFNLVKGIGSVRMKALLEYFGDAQTAWEASPSELYAAGLPQRVVEILLQVRSSISLEKVWERLLSAGISVLTWEDPGYPSRLAEIDQPPPVLYLRGALLDEDRWAVAMVGTRRITAYGRQATEEIAGTLARSGVTIVSGMARGVDAVAHQACLNAGGRTLAILGSGLDRIYPPENRRLADEICEHGALLSDYPLGTPPDAANFPPRNRIISGLSRAVIVVEAGETSGALITAAFAAEQGRDVYAVPGSIFAPQSKGTNRLIRDGASPLLNSQDVLQNLNLASVQEYRQARLSLPADATEAQLYQLLSEEPLHVDEIRARSSLPIELVSSALTMMELKGMIRHLGGMHYVAIREIGPEYMATGEQ